MGWVDGGKNFGPYIPYATRGYGLVGCSFVGSGTHRDISSSFDDMFDKRSSDGVDDMLDQRSSDGVFQS